LAANYRLNKRISGAAIRLLNLATGRAADAAVDLAREPIRKILLVRGNFRMGDSVLAAPAIFLFRKNFPDATIDFVGSPMSRALFENLPIDRHYEITRRFPDAMWSYFALIRRLRAFRYDLAVEVSGSQSAMGAFLVGFSGARFRAGLRGKRDRWLNIRLPKPAERNKYKSLPALVAALGLESEDISPRLILTEAETAEGKRRLAAAGLPDGVVGVFTGGRVSRLKRWPPENFVALAAALKSRGARVALFVGPEERELIPFFQRAAGADVPVLFEPSVRGFAAMVAACALFITCDSGPMHLACAVGTRTLAIFQKADHRHWGPPEAVCRIVYQEGGATVEQVLEAALDEAPRAARSA
ncbi:MAG TPA: glycosyltransferase family 9 protein, partial [Candidatus Binatia bacterium]|nr:glycosyltransferase family 9 protein [Candidatus Binatia bacterium]